MGIPAKASGCLMLALLLASSVACRSAQKVGSTEASPTPALKDTNVAGVAGSATPTPTDVVISRPAYTVTYPGEWKLDEKDEDFDLDHYFSIDAPGSCHVTFFLYTSKMNEKTHIDTQNAKMKEVVFKAEPSEAPFLLGAPSREPGSSFEAR